MATNTPKRPEILGQWARASIPTQWSATPPERRAVLVDAISAAIVRAKAPRSLGRASYWTLAAAAGVAVLVGLGAVGSRAREAREPLAGRLVALSGPAATVLTGREVTAVLPSGTSSLAFDSLVETGRESSSRIDLASGVEILLGSDTRVSLPHAKDRSNPREELGLGGGMIRVDVPKLRPGRFFAIHTPDTWVTVHGTSFSVEVSGASPARPLNTKVCVTEGVVTVQRFDAPEVFLTAGMQWESATAGEVPVREETSLAPDAKPAVKGEVAERRPSRSSVERPLLEITAARPAPPGVNPGRPAAEYTAALADQNRLFAQAMTAREQGDGAGALQKLESFVRRYPGSPLAEDAYVELFRGLSRMGDGAGAARAARRYLALYGDGFARDEARDLALDPGGSP